MKIWIKRPVIRDIDIESKMRLQQLIDIEKTKLSSHSLQGSDHRAEKKVHERDRQFRQKTEENR